MGRVLKTAFWQNTEPSMTITVKQALNIGGLKEGRVLAGAQHLDRVINHINILEAPIESSWDAQDHLFITSFYALRENTPLQIEAVKSLAEGGCAALVFQKGILDALDPNVIQQAELSGLPLIEVDEENYYPAIISPIVQAISQKKTLLIQRSQEIHRRLTGLILSGNGLQAIVDALHELIARPVTIINRWGDSLASSPATDLAQSDMLPHSQLLEIVQSPSKGLTWHLDSQSWLVPLMTGEKGEVANLMLVTDPQQSASPMDLTAIEQAATVATLELAKQRAVLETEKRLKRDFLDDLLTGEYDSIHALTARGRSLGWDLLNKRVIMLVDLNQFEAYYLQHLEKGEAHIQQIKQQLLNSVLRIVIRENPSSIVVERSDSIVVMLHYLEDVPLPQAQKTTKELAHAIFSTVPQTLNDLSISIAIGGFYESAIELRRSYQEAIAALDVSKRLSSAPAVVSYDDVALFVLLKEFASHTEVNRWLDQTLGQLSAYDQQNGSELVKTLETYFDTNQVAQQAAHRLFIHPKTLKYRLRRIEEILGTNPFDGDRQLSFYLATKLTGLL